MNVLLMKEIFERNDAPVNALRFFEELRCSGNVEIETVQYGDRIAYDDHKVLEVFLNVVDTILLNDGEWVFYKEDELILSVLLDGEEGHLLDTELVEVVKVPQGTGAWWNDWELRLHGHIDFDMEYEV